jgi:hypothetical protein
MENVTGPQLVKKFPAFYGTRRFNTSFTSACHLYARLKSKEILLSRWHQKIRVLEEVVSRQINGLELRTSFTTKVKFSCSVTPCGLVYIYDDVSEGPATPIIRVDNATSAAAGTSKLK